ncbi:hypothetical protein Asi02nite_81400 [Asanoa siamensis]|uniref:Integrase catalytic domain-containing protein n=1 Tax=Asanoa siamensis TaxID=926357 RepID=A0ABQ4D679_9ACTN|nr:hypothetical protein Asi02nite_81400 [Asanoa siamensis]
MPGWHSEDEVAARYGVSRQTIHNWLARYAAEGIKGLEDRSHRPYVCPHRVDASTEALVCELRRDHPRWGPRRLRFEAGRRGVTPPPARATVYRIPRRNNLVPAVPRKRRREDYRRWERPEPMELWQMDIVGGVLLADGTEAKVVTGLDDHFRYCVIATVVRRATGRAVCAVFAAALTRFGLPGEVLADNGKQFTGRFTTPRSPTTAGKVERFHQSLQGEMPGRPGVRHHRAGPNRGGRVRRRIQLRPAAPGHRRRLPRRPVPPPDPRSGPDRGARAEAAPAVRAVAHRATGPEDATGRRGRYRVGDRVHRPSGAGAARSSRATVGEP